MWQCSYRNRYGFTVTTEHYSYFFAELEALHVVALGYMPILRNAELVEWPVRRMELSQSALVA